MGDFVKRLSSRKFLLAEQNVLILLGLGALGLVGWDEVLLALVVNGGAYKAADVADKFASRPSEDKTKTIAEYLALTKEALDRYERHVEAMREGLP